jgi:hypothetical protein
MLQYSYCFLLLWGDPSGWIDKWREERNVFVVFIEFSCIIFKLSGRSYLILRNMVYGCRWWASPYALNEQTTKSLRVRYMFWTSLWIVAFYLHHVIEFCRVDVTLVNLCVTHSEIMLLILSCEVHRFQIVPFGQPKNGGCCVHIWFLTRVPSVCDFNSITPLFSVTPISGMCTENS